jgi:hypothetical protein
LAHATATLAAPNETSASPIFDDIFPRKQIDTSIMGVNAFVNDARFGTIGEQFLEVKNTLRLNYVRVLFAWNDDVQPSPTAAPNFSFYDDIAAKLPNGTRAIVVLTGLPSWMSDPKNWAGGTARTAFVRQWVRKVAARYSRNRRITGYQIWNEPNDSANPDHTLLGIQDSPANYVEMLRRSYGVVQKQKGKKIVINAATTAINQGFPRALEYNNGMLAAGAEAYVKAWAVHYYGQQFENLLRPGGVEDSLNTIRKPIWITESGAQGVSEQLEYVERTWPFLKERIPKIQRFYLYQFTEATAADTTYGLRNLTEGFTVSDLYIYLRDR